MRTFIPERRHVPHCSTRLLSSTARQMARPSTMLAPSGFSEYKSLPCFRRSDGHVRVPVVRRGIHDRIHIAAGQHLAKIAIHIALRQSGELRRTLGMLGIHIAHGDDLHALIAHQRPQIAGALAADADAGEAHLAVRRHRARTPQHGGETMKGTAVCRN
jgi:hypothetical protein